MIKAFKYFLPLLSVPLVIACGSNSNKSNNPTTIKRGAGANNECVVSVRCQNSSVSLTSTGTDWTHTLDQTVTTGSPCSFFFRANLGYNLPSDIFSIEKKEGGGKITEYTYAAVDEKVNKLTFTPTTDVYVNVVADTTCVTATINATNGVTAGFKYNGSLTYVDWGDGTVNQETSHTYNVTQECAITVAGNISSVSFGDNNPTANAYSGNANISKISLRNTIKYIPTGAFSNLAGLTGISIPQTVTKIAPRSFSGCNNLVNITLDDNPKYKTFNNNDIVDNSTHTLLFSNSNEALDSSITSIGDYAYENSAIQSLAIPNTVTAFGAYAFNNCSSLSSLDLTDYTEPPALATGAFNGCTSLKSIDLKNSNAVEAFRNNAAWALVEDKIPFETPASKCFTITALEDNTKIGIQGRGTIAEVSYDVNWEYRIKDTNDSWTQITLEPGFEYYELKTLSAGQAMEIKASADNGSIASIDNNNDKEWYWQFCSIDTVGTAEKPYTISNNIASLLYEDFEMHDIWESTSFARLFSGEGLDTTKGTSQVVDASKLYIPFNSIPIKGFKECFSNSPLEKAPELPASNVASKGYYGMFKGCQSLTEAPALPATVIDGSCYTSMFEKSGLIKAPALPKNSVPYAAYSGMFRDCTSLIKAPALPAQSLEEQCYECMFQGCISLTEAPALPATTLATRCYANMFDSTGIVIAPELPAKKLAANCYQGMFSNQYAIVYEQYPEYVSSLTTAPTFPSELLLSGTYCCQEMFLGCVNLVNNIPTKFGSDVDQAPAKYALESMFKGCTKIKTAPSVPTIDSSVLIKDVMGCYNNMFNGCSSLNVVVDSTSGSKQQIVEFLSAPAPGLYAKNMFTDTKSITGTFTPTASTTCYYEPY